ncbi:acryloyl-CoA reductase [Sporolactobacillus nakayamae]|uniref:Putative quinone oxidoreductase, YhdH/YhfP family n=1 Tax=Sporolactobacillus nakayamae TaxID=269670 RepID=A0A1I2V8K8_9BACL|nr:acryloyl-CoA reductase [Sporolactobacillus nakayamae]SFG83511.1 putative quinone oxidoreductase, YhdH/YhfP family [Sporolactobacillus nakayamae]
MSQSFSAFVVDKKADQHTVEIKQLELGNLPKEDVLIKVLYSSVNYKDALACTPDGKIVTAYPFIPGIDLAGVVVSSKDHRFKSGDQVIATGFEIGVTTFGGFSGYASLPGDWIVPLPSQMTLEESMIFGTAGFTAALAIAKLEQNGLTPEKGKVLVTGATGGVGTTAVAMLSRLGYDVIASTGKSSQADYLNQLGATAVLPRTAIYDGKIKALDKTQFAAAIDPVGGNQLASLLSKINYGGSVAVCGLTGGSKVPTTVFPFILRGINLLGIDSVYCPMPLRKTLWNRMATELKDSQKLAMIKKEIPFQALPEVLPKLLEGNSVGRIVVKMV